jgi:hypothetical protein
MSNVLRVEGVDKILQQIGERIKKTAQDLNAVVAVGYSTAYALYVHENIEMKWRGLPRRHPAKGVYWGPKGQAKFLEQPFRELNRSGVTGDIVRKALLRGATMSQALVLAGLRIQRDSQKLVPIDTGTLKNSAFTVVESGAKTTSGVS